MQEKGNILESIAIIIGLLIMVVIVIGVIYVLIMTFTSSNKAENSTLNEEISEEEIIQSEADFKEECAEYEYKEIARNSSNYIDKKVKFTGKVIQVQEDTYLFDSSKNTITLRVNVTKDEYGFYDDTVYCTYEYSNNESKILEDDIITFYGICKGEESYISILGSKITLPSVEIKYLTINN